MFTNIEYVTIGFITFINIVAFSLIAIDKRRSTRGDSTERIPEGILFFLAAAFGSVGVYLAMFVFRHKTRKWYFLIGVPILIVQNVATLYLICSFFVKI